MNLQVVRRVAIQLQALRTLTDEPTKLIRSFAGRLEVLQAHCGLRELEDLQQSLQALALAPYGAASVLASLLQDEDMKFNEVVAHVVDAVPSKVNSYLGCIDDMPGENRLELLEFGHCPARQTVVATSGTDY